MDNQNKLNYNNIIIEWINHDTFKITDIVTNKIIYTDPFKLQSFKGTFEPADIILVTHSHYDHYEKESIELIANDNTQIFLTKDIDDLPSKGIIKRVEPGINFDLGNIKIEAIPAYNTNKPYHPKENKWVGYIITVENISIYHAGDTDIIPEMKELKNIDIALLPVSGTYVMNAEEAAEACSIINPKIAIPMHYGTIVGSVRDAERFKELAKCSVKIL